MQLEEKRRQIEQEKRKMEATMNQQQQKVGKAAFLQAINKVNTSRAVNQSIHPLLKCVFFNYALHVKCIGDF